MTTFACCKCCSGFAAHDPPHVWPCPAHQKWKGGTEDTPKRVRPRTPQPKDAT